MLIIRFVLYYFLKWFFFVFIQESDRSSNGSPELASGTLQEHHMMLEGMKNCRKRRRSSSPENLDHAKRAAKAQAHLNGTSVYTLDLFFY